MGKPIPKTILVLLLVAMLMSPVLAGQVRELQWPDLAKKIEFEDPFEALSQEHLRELSIYARIEGLKKTSPGCSNVHGFPLRSGNQKKLIQTRLYLY